MAKEGLGFLAGVILFALIMMAGAWISGSLTTKILAGLGWIFAVFTVFFFRDPERTIPPGDDIIVSPADGKIVQIMKVREDKFLHDDAIQVSIFLSVFDVHINRIPMSGRVGYFEYQPGTFLPAYKALASRSNEQTIIGIERDSVKIVVKQIAGILARRIVCYPREGYRVRKGERFGMIKFGSRVDLILPLSAEILVKENDRVKGGETIIARIKNE